MAEQFKVIFTGSLHSGAVPDQVAEQFAQRFSCGLERAEKLVQSGRDVVIKSGVDQQKAEKYASALESLGMETRIEAALVLELEGDEPEPTKPFTPLSPPQNSSANESADQSSNADSMQGAADISSQPEAHIQAQTQAQAHTHTQAAKKPEVVYQMAGSNPYQAPNADLTPDFEQGDMTGPVSVSAGNGWRWLAEGFLYFKRNPVAWILTFLAWIVITVIFNFIPIVGSLVLWLVSPVITAGYMLGCREQEEGGDFQFGHLFAGFSENLGQLILVGILYMVGTIVIAVGIAFFAGGAALLFGDMSGAGMGPEVMSAMLLPILLAMAAIIPLIMAYWFAPALVVLNDMSAIAAMKLSFVACLRNLLPFLVYGLMLTVLFVIGSIPLGLGLLVVIPMMVASIYTAYRDIFYS